MQEKEGSIRLTVNFDFPQLALGTLQVNVVGASEILAADKGRNGEADTSDPFAIVAVTQMHDGTKAEQKHVTDKIERTLEPRWNASFY
eukprot:COSAG04_NODE_27911_length_279_cov_0.572222_1_plen_87_part_01